LHWPDVVLVVRRRRWAGERTPRRMESRRRARRGRTEGERR
jgi:hypothetical protein